MLFNSNWDSNPLRNVLLKAADLIRHGGLCKNQRYSGESYCFHGALQMASTGDKSWGTSKLHQEASDMVAKILMARGVTNIYISTKPHYEPGKATISMGAGCAFWNNEPERTAAEVIAVLEEAAEKVPVDA